MGMLASSVLMVGDEAGSFKYMHCLCCPVGNERGASIGSQPQDYAL